MLTRTKYDYLGLWSINLVQFNQIQTLTKLFVKLDESFKSRKKLYLPSGEQRNTCIPANQSTMKIAGGSQNGQLKSTLQ